MRTTEVVCMASFIFFLLAFGLLIAGFASPYWYGTEAGNTETWEGLWRKCTETGTTEDCDNIDIGDSPNWQRATIALMACSFIFALVAGLSAMFLPVTSGLQIIAGLFAVVAVAILGTEVKEMDDDDNTAKEYNFLWGFALTCAAGGIFIINGLIVACYAGYQGCYVDPVAPCCRDFRAPWSSSRRKYYEDDYGYGPGPGYGYGGPQRAPSMAYPPTMAPTMAPRQSMYMSAPRQPMVYGGMGGMAAPTIATTGYGTAYQPQPRASMYPGMARQSIYSRY